MSEKLKDEILATEASNDIQKEIGDENMASIAENLNEQKTDKKSKKGNKKTDKKRKPFPDVAKCVLVLTCIAVIAGVLLGVVNFYTYVDPDTALMKKVSEAYSQDISFVAKDEKRVVNVDGSKSFVNGCYVLYDKVATAEDKKENKIAYLVTGSGAYKGTLQLIVYVTASTGKIDKISVFAHSETPSPGGVALKDANLSKFYGIDLASITDYTLISTKDEAEDYVGNTSGATYTNRAIVNAVISVAYSFNNYVEG